MAASNRENPDFHLGLSGEKDSNKRGVRSEEYSLRKRPPSKLPKRENDVYINSKSDTKAQLARCHKLFDSGYQEIYIHGLGVAVCQAVSLALQLQRESEGDITISPNTSTVEVTDDLEPETDELEPKSQNRSVSAVHIKVSYVDVTVDRKENSKARGSPGAAENETTGKPNQKKRKRKRQSVS